MDPRDELKVEKGGILLSLVRYLTGIPLSVLRMQSDILFYDAEDLYGEYSNFYGTKHDSNYRLVIDEDLWSTTEHFYQTSKFLGPNATDLDREYARIIASVDTPNKAFCLARQKKLTGYQVKWKLTAKSSTTLASVIDHYKSLGVKMRSDWDQVKDEIMKQALYAKFTQNPHLKDKLLSTRGRRLVEHTSRDAYWGDGGNGQGLNKLGQFLMELRDLLDQQSSAEPTPTIIIPKNKLKIRLKPTPTPPIIPTESKLMVTLKH